MDRAAVAALTEIAFSTPAGDLGEAFAADLRPIIRYAALRAWDLPGVPPAVDSETLGEAQAAAARVRKAIAEMVSRRRADEPRDDALSALIAAADSTEREVEAERILSAARNAEPVPGDASHSLDLVTLYEGVGTTAELEAISIRGVLESAGIASVLSGTPAIPNLPFGVKVPREMLEQARAAIEEARTAGPAAAEEAEQTTEPQSGPV